MKILQVKDQQAGGRAGYDVFAEAVKNGAQVFGLATGSTPISIYDELKLATWTSQIRFQSTWMSTRACLVRTSKATVTS